LKNIKFPLERGSRCHNNNKTPLGGLFDCAGGGRGREEGAVVVEIKYILVNEKRIWAFFIGVAACWHFSGLLLE
jgi:hypothetical protein